MTPSITKPTLADHVERSTFRKDYGVFATHTRTELIAITGNRSAGRILREWSGPASLSLPAIADVDGDGLAEIVLQAADGSVYWLGPAP